ncbi:MAG TPA: OadG-related small transporter subunit [Lachnospiraceae bacterium]|nr:OadG-related small transporter subunit [Lachnospiraceae bacterium]
MKENILNALEIMGFGMAGIFAAIIIIMILVWILQKMDNVGKKKENQ